MSFSIGAWLGLDRTGVLGEGVVEVDWRERAHTVRSNSLSTSCGTKYMLVSLPRILPINYLPPVLVDRSND